MAESPEEKARREAEELFAKNAVAPPSRDVELPVMGSSKSLSEVEDEGGQASDLVATLRRLFPSFPEHQLDRICRAIMVGRVLHDTMLNRINLTVTSIVEDWNDDDIEDGGDGEMDFMYILNVITTAFEIGLDSKGREDAIQLHGAAKESEELEKLANKLG
jgi:hypothetical protein